MRKMIGGGRARVAGRRHVGEHDRSGGTGGAPALIASGARGVKEVGVQKRGTGAPDPWAAGRCRPRSRPPASARVARRRRYLRSNRRERRRDRRPVRPASGAGKRVVELQQLEGRAARAISQPPRLRDIGIVEAGAGASGSRRPSGGRAVLTRTAGARPVVGAPPGLCGPPPAAPPAIAHVRASTARQKGPAECLRAGRGRRRARGPRARACRSPRGWRSPASTRSARSAPMQGCATRSA